MRYTVDDFKLLYDWPSCLNLDSSDPRWLKVLNEALERLMGMGRWVGTYQRYQLCTNNACLTWPREFATIEVLDICGTPVTIRNEWFEFIDNGPGLWRGNCQGNALGCQSINYLDRGRGFVTFDDPKVNCYIRLFVQFADDAGKVVNLRGWDSNQQWVLTDNGATVGENLTLNGTYVDSETVFMPQVFREVVKAKTAGFVRAYFYAEDDPYITGIDADGNLHPIDPALVALTPIAAWEPGETIPNYRRCVIPMLQSSGRACGSDTTTPVTRKPTVTVMAKLAFIPMESGLDFIPLTNAPAIKMAMIAVQKQERGDISGSQAAMRGTFNPITRKFEDGAVPLLEAELEEFQGAGSVVPLRLERGYDNANVLNFL